MREGLTRGEQRSWVTQDASARTKVATIKGMLSSGTEGLEASQPRCGSCLDLEGVRVETTRPFPTLQGVGHVIPIRHG